ncbi:MAG TPA: ammonium transporter [Polyangium sp.]|nr:ammonium transporter [Polyangium sp.]
MAKIVGADTAWILVSMALVMFMGPGLALFYGGLVRSKNVLSTFMHSFFAMGLVSVLWVVVGYSIAFGPSHGGLIGGLDHVLGRGVGFEPRDGQTIPHLLFMGYQMMFAVITPALISGAVAERMRFSAYVLFVALWSLFVYGPVAHWVWAPGGFLFARGALDFAGGTVVHLTSGVSALVLAFVLGKRQGYPRRKAPPHDLTMTLLGGGMLWFGWFGFNAGSSLAANEIAVLAAINTHVAAASGALCWAAIEWVRHNKPSTLGVVSGFVAGLVAITPAAGYVGPAESLAIGVIASGVCFVAVVAKGRFGYDDALDAFGIHGVGGAAGALLTGVLATTARNPAGKDGLLRGGFAVFGEQLLSVFIAAAYAATITFGLAKLLERTVGLRASSDDESEGLDASMHGEEAFATADGGAHYERREERMENVSAPVEQH